MSETCTNESDTSDASQANSAFPPPMDFSSFTEEAGDVQGPSVSMDRFNKVFGFKSIEPQLFSRTFIDNLLHQTEEWFQ